MWLLACVFMLFISPGSTFDPIPCCHISHVRHVIQTKPVQIATIYLPGNRTCDGFSLAKITSVKYGTRGLAYTECANGWNVIAFLLHITSELSNITSEQFIKLRHAMLDMQEQFEFSLLLRSDLNKFKYIWTAG